MTMVDSMTKSIALVFGDKRTKNNILSELSKYSLKDFREMSDDLRFEMLKQYEVKEEPDKTK